MCTAGQSHLYTSVPNFVVHDVHLGLKSFVAESLAKQKLVKVRNQDFRAEGIIQQDREFMPES